MLALRGNLHLLTRMRREGHRGWRWGGAVTEGRAPVESMLSIHKPCSDPTTMKKKSSQNHLPGQTKEGREQSG